MRAFRTRFNDFAVPTLLVLAAAMAACGSVTSQAESESAQSSDAPAAAEAAGCALPWESMAQVRDCATPDYEQADADGNQLNIVVPSNDPAVIAAALADAWLRNENNAEQVVVWGWSDESVIGTGFDRGVASEQGVLGELLVFEVCTTWDEFEGIGEICGETVEFTIEQ